MTIDHAESHAIIPDGMRRTADAYQSSPAVSVAGGRLIFVSGQVGSDEAGQPIADPEAQFVAAIENVREVLEAAGGTLADVVEMTTYFTSMADLRVLPTSRSGSSQRRRIRRGPPSSSLNLFSPGCVSK